MKLLTSSTIWIVIFFCLSGCNRLIQGAPAAAPTGVTVTAGDTSAIVSWDVVPGVQYFVYWDVGSNMSVDGCSSSPTCVAAAYVSPPFSISGLVNGRQYSVTINGRTEGAKGGPGSKAVPFIPVQAGASSTWLAGNPNPLGSNDLFGLTYGNIFSSTGANLGNGYVSVGTNSALYYGIVDSLGVLNWTPIANPTSLPSIPLKAVANSGAIFVAVGAGGNILYSANYAESWATETSGTTNDLYALYGSGNFFMAAGQNGTILSSSGGVTWSAALSTGTTNTLRGITYGNGVYLAVGDAGTLLATTSASGTWTANSTIPASVNLNSVAYGYVVSATTGQATPTFVAVGSGGSVFFSTDNCVTWTPATITANTLNAITFGTRTGGSGSNVYTVASASQFVAADSSGNVYTSADGINWSAAQNLGAFGGSSINTIAAGLYDYTAVGASGLNMHSM
jgi:hypothetical protein